MEWAHLFSPKILERGLTYYQKGLVSKVNNQNGMIQAVVLGSRPYDVTLDIRDGFVNDVSCDCPYATQENYCKHEAALLFYLEDQGMIKKQKKSILEPIKTLVNETDQTLLREFLIEVLSKDYDLYDKLKRSLGIQVTSNEIQSYQNQVSMILVDFTDFDGFVDYQETTNLCCELENFLDEKLSELIESQEYMAAFQLISFLFIEIGELEMDDSYGALGALLYSYVNLWSTIISKASPQEQAIMFDWFMKQLLPIYQGDETDYLLQVFFEKGLFEETVFLTKKLELTTKKIHEILENKDEWYYHYQLNRWTGYHAQLLEKQSDSEEELVDFYKEFIYLPDIRMRYIDYCQRKHAYQEAILLAREGKTQADALIKYKIEFSLKLKDLYKEINDLKDYEKELWLLVTEYEPADLTIYREMKAFYPSEEWPNYRENIFSMLPEDARVDVLFKEDHLYEHLLAFVLNSPTLYALRQYETLLKPLYPQELLRKYSTEVMDMARKTSPRSFYRELVDILRHMQSYPKGRVKVNQIVMTWQQIYKNRPAMMDELSKLSF